MRRLFTTIGRAGPAMAWRRAMRRFSGSSTSSASRPKGSPSRAARTGSRTSRSPSACPAALDLIERAKKSSPQDPLYVAAVGAITNVSNAILIEPSIIQNIVLVWLGGNGHNWPHQREFNYMQDLKASRSHLRQRRAPRATALHAGGDPLCDHGAGDGAVRRRPRPHRRLPADDLQGLSQGPLRLVQGPLGHDGRRLARQRQMAALRPRAQPHCDR